MNGSGDASLRDRLAGLSGLAGLGVEALAVLEEKDCGLGRCAAGASVDLPEDGGALGILAGALSLHRRDDGRRLARFTPGTLVPGFPGLADEVRLEADAASEWLRVSNQAVDRLLASDAPGGDGPVAGLSRAAREIQLALHLSRLFDRLDGEALAALEAGIEWVTLRGGEWLFHEGDPGDAAFLVISGRLRAVAGAGKGERVLNEVGAGETVGEMALLTDDPRSAGVLAVRDAQLARLTREAFDRLTEHHPAALRRIAGFVVERLRRHGEGATSTPCVTLAVVGAHAGVETRPFCDALRDALAALGTTEVVDRARVAEALGGTGVADASDAVAAGIRLVQWLNDRERGAQHLLYRADEAFTPWTQRVLRQADHVLVLADAKDGPEPGETERRLAGCWPVGRAPLRSLVLRHADGTPRGTARWLARRDVDRHFHVRDGRPGDTQRVARIVTGNAVGLVLGGGGARGFAHLGVLRALEEASVPIDLVGGTSIGSIIAALPAQEMGWRQSTETCRHHISQLFDPTLPLVSLLAGRRIARRIQEVMGAWEIEDLPIPFFCVATNLSRAEEVVHRSGSLYEAVRSSISLPGILPPVTRDGDLFVDGGLLNNLPIDVMKAQSDGPVIAVDVSPEVDLRAPEAQLAGELSGWAVLWSRVNPFRPRLDTPWISSVMMRSAMVASIVNERSRQAATRASLHLRLPVDAWGLLEFEKLDEIAARGYEASEERVRAWWSEQCATPGGSSSASARA